MAIKQNKELDMQLRFETLLAEISTLFINLPADQIDNKIEDAQCRICKFLDIDRSTLWQFQEQEPGTLLLTHMCQPQGSRLTPDRMTSNDFFPWVLQRMVAGETVTVSKMTDLPEEAERDRKSFSLYGAKSGVYVPLSVGQGPVFGVLTFAAMNEERDWPEEVLREYKLLAQVFSNTLTRKKIELALRESEEDATGGFDDIICREILAVLKKIHWRISGPGGAAEALQLKYSTLQSKIKKLGIKRPPND